jgi:hypothetical protein
VHHGFQKTSSVLSDVTKIDIALVSQSRLQARLDREAALVNKTILWRVCLVTQISRVPFVILLGCSFLCTLLLAAYCDGAFEHKITDAEISAQEKAWDAKQRAWDADNPEIVKLMKFCDKHVNHQLCRNDCSVYPSDCPKNPYDSEPETYDQFMHRAYKTLNDE